MATARLFCYNPSPNPAISGTEQIGDIAAVVGVVNPDATLEWWNGPNEDPGYIIAYSDPSGNRPNSSERILSVNYTCHIGFFRTPVKTSQSFIDLTQIVTGNYSLTSATQSKEYLNNNGYWTSYTDSFVTDSLFMKLDATNYISGTWSDESGNNNNATINGATWLSTDGGIFDLDGTNDNISINHVSGLSLNTSTQKTIQVWVKLDALPPTTTQFPVFGKLSSSFGFDGYWGGVSTNSGQWVALTNGTTFQRSPNSGAIVASINTWYLFTFISQITAATNSSKLYLNTTLVGATAHGSDSYSESNPLYLGYIGSGVGSYYLNGKIGACYFYTKGLSDQEIIDNYNSTKSKYGL
jgi:hypothetical protein